MSETVIIEILGTGCPKCKKLEENARKAVEELGAASEISKISGIEDIINYGVMSTPAIAVNGKIRCSGRIPDVEEIKEWVKSL